VTINQLETYGVVTGAATAAAVIPVLYRFYRVNQEISSYRLGRQIDASSVLERRAHNRNRGLDYGLDASVFSKMTPFAWAEKQRPLNLVPQYSSVAFESYRTKAREIMEKLRNEDVFDLIEKADLAHLVLNSIDLNKSSSNTGCMLNLVPVPNELWTVKKTLIATRRVDWLKYRNIQRNLNDITRNEAKIVVQLTHAGSTYVVRCDEDSLTPLIESNFELNEGEASASSNPLETFFKKKVIAKLGSRLGPYAEEMWQKCRWTELSHAATPGNWSVFGAVDLDEGTYSNIARASHVPFVRLNVSEEKKREYLSKLSVNGRFSMQLADGLSSV